MIKNKWITIVMALWMGLSASALAAEEWIPDLLKPWKNWVLFDDKTYDCPYVMNNQAQKLCAWPSVLQLNVQKNQATFSQVWQVFNEGWISLPGDKQHWPQQVKIAGQPVAVLAQNDLPGIWLKPGTYHLEGKFFWQNTPQFLTLPFQSRLLSLQQDNQAVLFPKVDEVGRLWLNQSAQTAKQNMANDQVIRVFRAITDSVPMTINTIIQLDISGNARELTLGPVLLPQQIPANIQSPLPAKLDKNGVLTLQVQPGAWQIVIQSYALAETNALTLPSVAANSYWPQEELWVFEAQPDIRTVELTGLPRIDPTQTLLPKPLQQFPAFRVKPEEKLNFVVKQHGAVAQQNRLNVQRQAWVDFSGHGYTVVDQLTGMMQSQWRIEQFPPLVAGRMEIADQMQLLTRLPNSMGVGIEVRERDVNVTAVSRQEKGIYHLPINGWNVALDNITTKIHLPPGWRILGIVGADKTEGTWVDSWNVWEGFILFFVSIAVLKLSGMLWGVFALITLVLLHNEPFAPFYIWLNLILAQTLLLITTQAKWHKFALLYKRLSFAALFLIALPFVFQQIQTAIYIQTDPRQIPMTATAETAYPQNVGVTFGGGMARQKMMTAAPAMALMASAPGQAEMLASQDAAPSIRGYQPNGIVQTGPAVPIWHWNEAQFSQNAVAASAEKVDIFYLTPWMVRLLNIVRVLLLVCLSLHLWYWGKSLTRDTTRVLPIFILLGGLISSGSFPTPTYANEMPSQQILDVLKERLLQPARCAPQCGSIAAMTVDISEDHLTLTLNVNADDNIAIPLPGDSQWLAQTIEVDGHPGVGIAMPQQPLLLALTPGAHEVILKGPLPQVDRLTIITPVVPQHITLARAQGWQVTNVVDQLLQGRGIEVVRDVAETQTGQTTKNEVTNEFPPYVQIQRQFHFDKTFTVETQVTRVAPQSGAISLSVPLLAGEKVIEEGFSIQNNAININLSPDQNSIHWHSILPEETAFTLQAQALPYMSENWQFEVSPLWHLKTEGLASTLNVGQPTWLPLWRPWPNEKLQVALTQPQSVKGNTLTLARMILHTDIGQREKINTLQLRLRSSLGGQHILTLPEGAKVAEVIANHRPIPINQVQRQLILPVLPGVQDFQIRWHEPNTQLTRVKTAEAQVGLPTTNAVMSLTLPENRWIIATGGPGLGPSVMVWALVVVMLALGFALWRFTAFPLSLVDWVLLALGVSMALPLSLLLLITWFAVLIHRKNHPPALSPRLHKVVQVLLVLFTLIVFGCLLGNLGYGLLGSPQMWVQGFDPRFIENIQAQYQPLVWYVDHTPAALMQGWVISLPLWVYRIFMLAWSLWFAFAVIKWLRWGWEGFRAGRV